MAKTTAPLLSFEAAGQIGNSLVFSKWKGRSYARRYVVPANPRTAAQVVIRNTFQWLQKIYPFLPAGSTGAWQLYADNSRFTQRNGFTKINQPIIRSETDLSNILLSTAAGGGLAAAGATFTAASGAIEVAIAEPTMPAGWTISNAHAVALENVNPQTGAIPDVGSAEDATDPHEPDVTGLLPATEYVINAWFEYLKPDGSTAYGTPERAVVTTLA